MIDDQATTRIIKALSQIIAAGGPAEEDDTNDMDYTDHTDTDASTLNRANKALQRCK